MKNVGRKDANIRYALAGVMIIIGALLLNTQAGIASALFIGAVVLSLTGLIGFCGLYKVFGIDTCPLDSKKRK